MRARRATSTSSSASDRHSEHERSEHTDRTRQARAAARLARCCWRWRCCRCAALRAGSRLQPAQASRRGRAEVTLDRVVAIVNGDLILESDVDAEQRFAAFQPFSEAQRLRGSELIDG